MPKKTNQRGFVDPLSIIAIAFLVVSIFVGTAVVTNKGISLNIGEKAADFSKAECGGCDGKYKLVWDRDEEVCKKRENKECASAETAARKAPAETCLQNNGGKCVTSGTCAGEGLVNGSGSCNKGICCYRPTKADLSQVDESGAGSTTGATCIQNCVNKGGTAYACAAECGVDASRPQSETQEGNISLSDYDKCIKDGNTPSECSSILQNIGQPITQTQCLQGQVECSGSNLLRTCSTSGTWTVTSCLYGCLSNKCNPAPQTTVTTRADGQCLGPAEKCTSGNSYFDTSCTPTETRCGTKSTLVTVADGTCLKNNQTCKTGGYVDLTCGGRNYRCGTKPTVTVGINASGGVTTQPTQQQGCSFNGSSYVVTYAEGATTKYTQTPCGPSLTTTAIDSHGCTAGTEYVTQLGRCTNPIEAFLFKTAPEDPTALIAATYLTPALSSLGPVTTFGGKLLQPIANFLSNPYVQTGIRLGNTGLNLYQARQACVNPQTTAEQNLCTEAQIYLGLAYTDFLTGSAISFNFADTATDLGRLLRAGATTTSIAEAGANIYQTSQQCFGENANTLGCLLQGGITAFHGGVVAQDLSNQVQNFTQIQPIYLDLQTQQLANAGLDWSVFQRATANHPETGRLWYSPYFVDLDTDLALKQDVQSIIQQVQATNPQSELDIVRNTSKIISQNFSGPNYNLAARTAIWEIAEKNGVYVPLGTLTSTKSTVCLENSYLCSIVLNQMGVSASTRYLSNVNPIDPGHAFVQAVTSQGAVWTDPTWGGPTKLLGPVNSLEEYAAQIQQIYKFEKLKSLSFPLNELIYTGTGYDAPTTFDQLLNQNH